MNSSSKMSWAVINQTHSQIGWQRNIYCKQAGNLVSIQLVGLGQDMKHSIHLKMCKLGLAHALQKSLKMSGWLLSQINYSYYKSNCSHMFSLTSRMKYLPVFTALITVVNCFILTALISYLCLLGATPSYFNKLSNNFFLLIPILVWNTSQYLVSVKRREMDLTAK